MQTVIEKMVFGGAALARTDQGVVFIDGALPGEKVEYAIESKQQGVLVGKLQSVLENSGRRRVPCCQYYNECGGCGWLHIDPQYQADLKKEIFIDSLVRIGKIKNIPEIEMFGSPETSYRIRAQVKTDGKGMFGFYKRKTNSIIAVQNCPLLSDKCNIVLDKMNSMKYCTTADSIKILGGNENVASSPQVNGLTTPETDISVDNYKFHVLGDSFFQSNRFLAGKMGSWAIPYTNGKVCVDLYGGTGLFSVFMSRQFEKVIMVESVRSQVELARRNFLENGIRQCTAVCSVAERLDDVVKCKPDLLVVDPPRTGLDKVVRKSIKTLSPAQIVYISCNPSTQARDVSAFVAEGYSITNAALFDCYPNTFHIETGLILKKQ